jgi:hypothetical protein
VKLYLARTKPCGKVRGYGNNLVLGLFNDVISNSDHIVFSDWMVVHQKMKEVIMAYLNML